jgi:AbrB family looped-hinge helix DNA binding protein
MPHSNSIGSKGQVTVPLEIRRRLGLKPGDRVEFVFHDGQAFLRPVRTEGNPLEKYFGALPAFKNKKQVNARVADLRGDDRG